MWTRFQASSLNSSLSVVHLKASTQTLEPLKTLESEWHTFTQLSTPNSLQTLLSCQMTSEFQKSWGSTLLTFTHLPWDTTQNCIHLLWTFTTLSLCQEILLRAKARIRKKMRNKLQFYHKICLWQKHQWKTMEFTWTMMGNTWQWLWCQTLIRSCWMRFLEHLTGRR